MREACEKNNQVSDAYKVSETIYKAFGKPMKLAAKPQEADDVPF